MNTPTLPELTAALACELDPGETVRWSGMPDPRAMARAVLPQAVAIGSFGLIFGVVVGAAAFSIWREVQGLSPVPPGETPSMVGVYVTAVFAMVLTAAGFCGLCGTPYRAAMNARRTIYAITDTRVIVFTIGRRGRTRIEALEPGHPLHIQRVSMADGRGDVTLYPGQVGSAAVRGTVVLRGVADARNVERLIRETFDPPGVLNTKQV